MVGLLAVDLWLVGPSLFQKKEVQCFVSMLLMLRDSSAHPTSIDFLSTEGEEWGFASIAEIRSNCLSPDRRCEPQSLPQWVLVLSKPQLLCCPFPPRMCAGSLSFCSSKAAQATQGCLEEVSLNLSIWPHCLLPHWASQRGWCLLGGFVCSGEVPYTDCAGAGKGDSSSGYIFSLPLQQKILKQEKASLTRIDLRKFA